MSCEAWLPDQSIACIATYQMQVCQLPHHPFLYTAQRAVDGIRHLAVDQRQ